MARSRIHPLQLCPVCLRKLHVALSFDPRARYVALGEFYREHALLDDAAWIADRLAFLSRG